MHVHWLHLSDVHVGKEPEHDYPWDRTSKNLLQKIRSWVGEEGPPDFVFITGDIADKGIETQFRVFETFLEDLDQTIGGSIKDKLFVIPGNHDVDRSKGAITYEAPKVYPDLFDPTEAGLQRRTAVLPRFEAFHAFLRRIGLDGQVLDKRQPYYCLKRSFNKLTIGILGINTAWLSQDPEQGDGNKIAGQWTEEGLLTPGISAFEQGLENIQDCDFALVLAHHPPEWIRPDHRTEIRALLGRRSALYINGHIHKPYVRNEDGWGYQFLAIQAGAAFEPHPDDRWHSRIQWCELDTMAKEILVQPVTWNRVGAEWQPDLEAFSIEKWDGKRFRVPLSQPEMPSTRTAGPSWTSPRGWLVVDRNFLAVRQRELSSKEVVAFFDGSQPTWRHALSEHVPFRGIVARITSQFDYPERAGKPLVRLITGAAGEGKTTVLLQALCKLVTAPASQWRVLWRDDPSADLPEETVRELPPGPWLIASDDAEWVAARCANGARILWSEGRADVHFLLAARDTDWIRRRAEDIGWRQWTDYDRIVLREMAPEDAQLIVKSWAAQGGRGLGSLAKVPEDDRAMHLVNAAKEEAVRPEGSFFGAMLKLRFGQDMTEHVRVLMNRLRPQRVGRRSLLDAFLFIAAPHTINILSLTSELLAEALGYGAENVPLVNQYVVRQLGEETAISAGRVLLVRHRSIADAAMRIAKEEQDVDAYYEELVRAAIRLRPFRFVYGFREFNFMGQAFREELGRTDLAVRLARAQVDMEPWNRFYLVELGASFGVDGKLALNACVAAAAIADIPGHPPPTDDNAKSALAGLGQAFGALHERTGEPLFMEARGAVALLGFKLHLDHITRSYFERYADEARAHGFQLTKPDEALKSMIRGITRAGELLEGQLPPAVPRPAKLRFRGLMRVCGLI